MSAHGAKEAPTRVVVVGAGPIGLAVAAEVSQRRALRLCAVVDKDPRKHGQVVGADVVDGVVVDADIDAVAASEADVAVVCTTSSFVDVAPTVRACLERGWHVVSTCEELVWPFALHPELAAAVDADAVRAGRAVVGTGVNPGFLMDALPVFLTAIASRVDKVTVLRAQDAAQRRAAFQQKVGVGLSVDEFRARVAAGGFLHRGLRESAGFVAAALGLREFDCSETHAPVVRDGVVRGVEQRCVVSAADVVRVELCFEAWAGHPDPRDEIVVAGAPALRLVTHGVHGDVATRAIAVNAVSAVRLARPGLRTLLDLPLVSGRF